ncbi:hypothetical protein [Pedobacter sp. MW01-1-1]|uniref:hypothetical protein n=1 Tax=Pedobacter sp. MW01-1-1 TaxID=3383027 RepID=UPI003FEF32E4
MSTSSAISNGSNWSLVKKIAFRFFFFLFGLFIILHNNGAFPKFAYLIQYPNQVLFNFVPWFSKSILGYNFQFNNVPNGSGDTSYSWVLLLLILLVSIIGCVIWSILDRKRKSYHAAYYWLVVLIRFYLAFTLIMYGAVKIIKLQLPDPSLYRLFQTFGESSPMGLAWTFLGFSKGYNMFMGIIEVSAFLLLFRKTMVIGALLSLATCVQIMAVNYFYDVPVKIVSTALVLMCLFILAPNFVRIFRFFIGHDNQQLVRIYKPKFKRIWIAKLSYAGKYLFIGFYLFVLIEMVISMNKINGANISKPFMYGVYDVKVMSRNGIELQPLITDSIRWKQMLLTKAGFLRIKTMDDSLSNFSVVFDRERKKLDLYSQNRENIHFKLSYKTIGKDNLEFFGLRNKDSVFISLKGKDLKKILLTNRGFHWISEYPYNR